MEKVQKELTRDYEEVKSYTNVEVDNIKRTLMDVQKEMEDTVPTSK